MDAVRSAPPPVPCAAGDPRAALHRAVAAYPEATARRAVAVVRSLLRERWAHPTAAEWGGSRLTGDGYPVEVAFSTADDRLRLTVEPGSGRLDPGRRLALSAARVAEVGGVALAPEVLEALVAMQRRGPLRYGAWVSCRIGSGRPVLKVYAEVPDPAVRWPGHPAPPVGDREPALRMIALTPATGDTETYFRIPSLLPAHLPAVLAPAGVADRAAPLRDWLETLHGHRFRGRLPGPDVGVGYTVGAAGVRATVHFYARALWGGDRRIRARFAEVVAALGGDPTTYLAVTAPLAEVTGWRTRHGIVGVTLGAEGPPTVTLGVRPVAS